MTKTTKKRLMILIVIVVIGAGGLYGLVQIRDARRAAENAQTLSEAMEAYEAGEYERAVPLFSKVVRRDRSEYEPVMAFATSRAAVPIEGGRHIGQAKTLAELAEELRPDAVEPKELLLRLYAQIGFAAELIDTANALLEIEPTHYEAMASLPSAHLIRSEDDEALAAAELFAQAYPNDLRAQRMHVGLLLREGSSESRVIEKLRSLRETLGDTPETLIVRASAMFEMGRIDEAAELLRNMLDVEVGDAEILRQMLIIAEAAASEDSDLLSQTETRLAQKIDAGPGDSGFVALGFERFWKTDRSVLVARTLESRRDEIEIMSPDALGYGLLAAIEQDEADLASVLREALSSKSDQASADWLTVADAAESLDREAVNETLQTPQVNEVMRYVRGLFYRTKGEFEIAERQWGSLGADPQWRRARLSLADLLLGEGREREARAIINADRRGEKSPKELLILIDATLRLLESGRTNDSERAFAASLLDTVRTAGVGGGTFDPFAGRLALATGREDLAREYAATILERGPGIDPRSTVAFAQQLRNVDGDLADRLLDAMPEAGGSANSVVFARAERMFASGDEDGARDLIENAIASSDGVEKREFRRARARLMMSGWPEEAIGALAELSADYPGVPVVQRDLLEYPPSWTDRELVASAIERLREATGEDGIAWRVYDAQYSLQGEPDQKNASRVVLNLTQVLQIDPRNTEALLLLSDAYRQLGNDERSLAFLERALDAAENRARVYPLVIRDLLRAGEMEEARDRLLQFAAIDDVTPDVRRVRADMLEEQSMLDLAARDRAGLAESGNPTDVVSLAGLRTRAGDRDGAMRALSSIAGSPTLSARDRIRMAGLYIALDEVGLADEAVMGLPQSSELGEREFVIADFFLKTGRTERGREMLESRASADSSADSWLRAVEIYRTAGLYEEAQRAVERLGEIDPAHPQLAELASAVETLRKIASGEDSSETTREFGEVVFPVSREGLGAIVQLLAGDDESDVAEELARVTAAYASGERGLDTFLVDLNRLTSENPRHYPAWRVLLHTQAKARQTDDAIRTARTMVQNFPSDPRPAQMATTLLAREGQFEVALAMAIEWRRRQLSDPRRPTIVIALLLLETGRANEALSELGAYEDEILSSPESDAGATTVYAEALVSAGQIRPAFDLLRVLVDANELRWEEVVRILNRGVSANPEYIAALREADRAADDDDVTRLALAQGWYGAALRGAGDEALERAIELAKLVYEGSDDDGLVLPAAAVLAGASYRSGSASEAIMYYRKALSIDGNQPDLLNNLAYILLEDGGDGRESIELAMRAIQMTEAGTGSSEALRDFYDTLAVAYTRAGQHERAATAYRSALDLEPSNASFRAGLVESLLESGETEAATREFEPLRALPDESPLHDRVRELESRLRR